MKKIFLSYCWADEKYADLVDDYFQQIGIKLIRDKRDLTYTSSISRFAKSIRKTSFAICIISDEFLKRENCMYEIVEFQKDDNFKKKICPIVVNYEDVIVNLQPQGIEEYAKYWEEMVENQNELINNITDNTKKEEQIIQLKKYVAIYDGIRSFLFFLKDAIYISNSKNGDLGIKTINENIFKKIGISPKINIEELYRITQLNTIEEAEEQLANYMYEHLIKENEYYFYTRANIYEKFGFYDLALYNFKQAYKTSAGFIIAYESIIMLYMKGIYEPDQQFVSMVHELEKIDPTNSTLKMAQGLLELKRGSYEESIETFKNVLEDIPSSKRCYIYNNIANAFEKMDNIEQAKENYQMSIKENPQYYQAYNNLSILYLMKYRNTENALSEVRKCLEINSTYYMGLNTLGLIYEEQKDYEQALNSYLHSFYSSRGKKKYSAPINNIGRVLDFEFLDEKCSIYYKLAYEINPDSLVCIFNLGNYYRKYTDDYQSAYNMLFRAWQIDTQNILCNMALGLLYYGKKNYTDALNYFAFSYSNNINYGSACLCLALCMLKLEKERKLITELLENFCGDYPLINDLNNVLHGNEGNLLADYLENDLLKRVEYDYVNVPEQIFKTLYINPVTNLQDAYQYILNHFFDR